MKIKSKNSILFDSSYIVALLDAQDKRHSQALVSFNIIDERKSGTAFLFPSTTLNETLFTLVKKGYKLKEVVEIIYRMINYHDSLTIPVDVLSMVDMLGDDYLLLRGDSGITKTGDYIIASIAHTYDSIVITADKQMTRVLKENKFNVFDYYNDPFEQLKECLKDR